MEPLEQALAVVEGVVAQICEKLGSDAKEHIFPDRLFVRAECEIQNGLDVDEAIDSIASSLMWDVQEKLEDKIINVKRIRDELVRTSKQVIIGDSTGKLKKNGKCIKEEQEPDEDLLTMDIDARGSMAASDGDGEGTEEGDGAESITNEDDNTRDSDSDATFIPPSPASLASPVSPEADDDDIRVLTPVPRPPAPLIELTDDSSDSYRYSLSSPSVSIVKEAQVNGKDPRTRLMNEIDLQDAENIGFARKSLATLFKEEKSLTDEADIEQNGEVNNMATYTTVEKAMIEVARAEPGELHNGDLAFDYSVGGLARQQKVEKSNMEKEVLLNGEANNKTLPGLQNESENKKRSLIDFLFNNAVNYRNPNDLLWEDAQYVCSLLPFFQLADVHQSMVDSFYHPDRRAYVLEQYYNLALDQEEYVSDDVFHGLLAARKRSFVEVDGAQPVVEGKRMRTNYAVDQQFLGAIRPQNIPDDPLPSTSGASNSLASSAVVADMSNVRNYNNAYGNSFKENGPIKVDPAREEWCKEKMEFVRAVVFGMDENVLRMQVDLCFCDVDVERLIERLMLEQEEGAGNVTQAPVEHGNPVSAAQAELPGSSAFHTVDREAAATSGINQEDDGDDGDDDAPGSSGENRQDAEAEDPADLEDHIAAQMSTLSEMFADADPDYLQERCVDNNGDQTNFQALVDELLKNNDYPKIEEYNKRQKRLEIKKKFIEGMSVEEFLEYFEDPEKVFTDPATAMSKIYMENARAQLKRDLPFHLQKDIDNELRKHNHHYLPTLRALQDNAKVSRRKTKRTSPLKERDLDDIFIKELCYVRMQSEIKEHLWKKDADKRRAFLWAKATHQLIECGCCCDDEVLEEDMDTCTAHGNKHKFCNNCIRRFAEEEIGQGRTSFRCLEGECKAEFSLGTLKKLMKPSVFSNILERKQQEEIAAAGIENLVACPFCNFQTIMPNMEDKVFKCLNPECMKDSCRSCKEPNHVPLRCEEVEKQYQKDARTFLENKMTEAMVRECWKCKKRFIKEDGCNKMRCSCGAMMCYICKKPIKGYDHFEDKPVPSDPSKCPLWSNSEKIHAEEVRDAADKLKKEMDPNMNLVHNPLNDVPEVPKHLSNKQRNPGLHHHHHHHHRHHHHHHHHHHPPAAHQNRQHFIFPLPAHNLVPPPLPLNPPQEALNPLQFVVQRAHNPLPPPAHQPVLPPVALGPIRDDQRHHHHHHLPPPARFENVILHPRPALQPQMGDDLVAQINEFNEVLQGVRMRNPQF